MRYVLIIFIILISFLILLFVKGQFKKTPHVIINNIYFKAEVAKNDQEKSLGLAKYFKINDDFIMVFPFDKEDYYSFWMKDMKFPIDIIFVRKNKIVKIFTNVPNPMNENSPLPIIKPGEKSDTVLEINAGLSDKFKFKKGDSVSLDY